MTETRYGGDRWLTQLQDDVGQWSEDNFGVSPLHGGSGSPPEHALLGIGEELGELTRSVLKREQGIDDSEKYADRDGVGCEAERDAVGDVMIYLLDMMHRTEDSTVTVANGLARTDAGVYEEHSDGVVDTIRVLYSEYGRLSTKRFHLYDGEDWEGEDSLDVLEMIAGRMAALLRVFCTLRGFDFKQCVLDAWQDVSGREWNSTVAQE